LRQPPAFYRTSGGGCIRPPGEETLNLITNGNFGTVSHQGRAFVALSVFYRLPA